MAEREAAGGFIGAGRIEQVHRPFHVGQVGLALPFGEGGAPRGGEGEGDEGEGDPSEGEGDPFEGTVDRDRSLVWTDPAILDDTSAVVKPVPLMPIFVPPAGGAEDGVTMVTLSAGFVY